MVRNNYQYCILAQIIINNYFYDILAKQISFCPCKIMLRLLYTSVQLTKTNL